jgi:hypothetical protein
MNGPQHGTRVTGLGEGIAQAVCDCGWHIRRFGHDKRLGTTDAEQAPEDAADPHQ